jgi:hypothetical protein
MDNVEHRRSDCTRHYPNDPECREHWQRVCNGYIGRFHEIKAACGWAPADTRAVGDRA